MIDIMGILSGKYCKFFINLQEILTCNLNSTDFMDYRMCNASNWLICLVIKLKNAYTDKDRYTTEFETDVNKIYMHMFLYSA